MEDVGSLLAVTAATQAETTAEEAQKTAEEALAVAEDAAHRADVAVEIAQVPVVETPSESESPEASLMDLLMSHIEGDSLYCQGVDERLSGIETRLDELALSVASLATATAVTEPEAEAEVSPAEVVQEAPIEPLTVEVSDTPGGVRGSFLKRLLLTDR